MGKSKEQISEINDFDKLIRLLFESMNSREFGAFEKVITEDVAFDFPGAGRTEGARRTLLLLKSLLRKYPVLIFTVNEIIVQENRACAIWVNEGKDSQGLPYNMSGVTLFHFSGDRISFISDYFKDTSFTEKVRQKT
jgi:ketosteroid isomerase-like protein